MSATVIPDLILSRRTSWRGSPASSRSFSLCQIGLTMFATGRSGFGKAAAGVPEPAKNSCAEIDIVKVAATTVAIVIRITSPTLQVLGVWQRHIRVPRQSFGRVAQPRKRQMGSSEEKPVARNHVDHFPAARDRHSRIMVERNRAVRLRELQSRVVHDVAPEQELITRRRNAHHGV